MNTHKTPALLLLVVLILFATPALAVDVEVGGRFLTGVPAGDFGDAVDNVGLGLEAHFGVRPQPCLTLGIGLNAMMYGSETRAYDLPLVEDFDLKTNNNLAGCFLFAQLRPFEGVFQPYAEARISCNYLWTESKLEDEDWWDDDEVARETNFDDCAFAFGGGGGLLIQLMEADGAENKPGWFLDFKATYMNGSEAEYLTEGDITIVEDAPVYAVSKSETDLMTYSLGIVVTF